MKINKKEVKEWAKAFVYSVALCALPMVAMADPSWAQKPKEFVDDILGGLKLLGYGVASVCFLWSMYEIIWNGKRLADMKNWFIGAVGCASFGAIVGMFFKK